MRKDSAKRIGSLENDSSWMERLARIVEPMAAVNVADGGTLSSFDESALMVEPLWLRARDIFEAER